ncbi:MerR family transcriptional regulator [Glutamicibacter uratoxydans]|uniref:MerR family transcriptional regulator n=1 Tax=Glutamicibacter uratoxydans TaxID=43667 RepID=A0A4Y4DTR1_GLUUR|nr:MerR family transcriptional regulator [Glutamicibacter uratoxydans]GED06860.1 MerR family transcriptional regulator [Glutamicibacter uratoxydans]
MSDPLLPHIDFEVPADGLPIGKAAEVLGVGVEALRYYEREGLLLRATPRDAGGRRRYGARDLAWISGLVLLRKTGMPIASIRVIADLSRRDGTESQRLAFFEEHRTRVIEQLEQTQRHLAAIDHKIISYRTAIASREAVTDERDAQ